MTNHSDMEPFTIAIPEADLEDVRERPRRTRWPKQEAGWERGVPVDYLKPLAGYWLEGFDWLE